MPIYRMRVAHRETGRECSIDIDAPNQQAAEAIASGEGWLIASVAEAAAHAPDRPPEATLGNVVDAIAAVQAELRTQRPSPTKPQTHSGYAVVAAILLVLVGMGMLFEDLKGMGRYHSDSFRSDNAVGATANAAEELVELTKRVSNSTRLIAYVVLGSALAVIVSGRR